ncbi:MAG: hypothetical protein ABI721_02595 [Candidatus Dojkabacteria bacterium]
MRNKLLIAYFLLFLTLSIFNVASEHNKLLIGFLYLSTFIFEVSAVYSAISAYGIKHPLGRSFAFICVGFTAAASGQIIWFYLRYIENINPFPSIADIFYLLAYIFIFIGYILMLRSLKLHWEKRYLEVLLLALLVAVSMGILVFHFEIITILQTGGPFLDKAITIAYGINDLVLIVMVLFILRTAIEYKKGDIFRPWIAIFFAQFLVLIGDILFSIFSKEYAKDISPYNLIAVVWFVANLLVIYGYYGFSDILKKAQDEMIFQVVSKKKDK